MLRFARTGPIVRSWADSTKFTEVFISPVEIHSCRRWGSVVANTNSPAMRWEAQPKSSTCTSLSNTRRSGMQGRWQPRGWSGWWTGSITETGFQMGARMDDATAGTGSAPHTESLKTFLDDVTPPCAGFVRLFSSLGPIATMTAGRARRL